MKTQYNFLNLYTSKKKSKSETLTIYFEIYRHTLKVEIH